MTINNKNKQIISNDKTLINHENGYKENSQLHSISIVNEKCPSKMGENL